MVGTTLSRKHVHVGNYKVGEHSQGKTTQAKAACRRQILGVQVAKKRLRRYKGGARVLAKLKVGVSVEYGRADQFQTLKQEQRFHLFNKIYWKACEDTAKLAKWGLDNVGAKNKTNMLRLWMMIPPLSPFSPPALVAPKTAIYLLR